MKTKSKVKSKVAQLVEVRTKVVLGIMLISAYMVTASLATLPFAGIEKNDKINYKINSIQVVEYDDWGMDRLPEYWESDGGNPYVFGYIQDLNSDPQWGYDIVAKDYCVAYGEKTLVEYSYDGEISSASIQCENGCFNGRCTYEYETCPAGWYCYNPSSRALLDDDCTWSNFEAKDRDDWRCVDGEFNFIGETTPETAVCDFNNDNVRNLADLSLFAQCQNIFDANNDGVHNLADVSLYASNNQDDVWCINNMFECYNVSTSSLDF